MVEEVEIKIGNSKRLVLKDGILQEKNLKVLENKQGILTDIIVTAIVFMVFGKSMGILIGVNSAVTRVVKLLIH